MKIGVRGHDLGIQDNISNLAHKTREYGFDYIQLVPKKILRNESCTLNDDLVEFIKREFDKEKIEIALLGAYFNPIHSNMDKVKMGIEEFKLYLEYAYRLGCKYVGTETGSYNDDWWTYNPKNHTEPAYQQVLETVKELVLVAERNDAYVAIEPAYNHVICDKERLERLIKDVNSSHLVVIIDLYNLLNFKNYQDYKTIFADFISTFKNKIKIFHFKDFLVEDGELIKVGLGEGYIDFEYIIHLIHENLPESIVIFEGVMKDKLAQSLAYIKSIVNKLS